MFHVQNPNNLRLIIIIHSFAITKHHQINSKYTIYALLYILYIWYIINKTINNYSIFSVSLEGNWSNVTVTRCKIWHGIQTLSFSNIKNPISIQNQNIFAKIYILDLCTGMKWSIRDNVNTLYGTDKGD